MVFLRLNYLLVGSEWQKQCFSSIAFTLISVYRLDNRCRKCKKTKAFGLVLLFHLQDRVAHFVCNPALSTDQPLRSSWHTRVSLIPNSRIVYLFSNPQRRAAHDKRARNLCTKKRIMHREKRARGNCILNYIDANTNITPSVFSMHNAPC